MGQNVTISSSGGAMSAKVELLTAPTSEIIGPRFGMQAAKTTENKYVCIYISNLILNNLHVKVTSVMRVVVPASSFALGVSK